MGNSSFLTMYNLIAPFLYTISVHCCHWSSQECPLASIVTIDTCASKWQGTGNNTSPISNSPLLKAHQQPPPLMGCDDTNHLQSKLRTNAKHTHSKCKLANLKSKQFRPCNFKFKVDSKVIQQVLINRVILEDILEFCVILEDMLEDILEDMCEGWRAFNSKMFKSPHLAHVVLKPSSTFAVSLGCPRHPHH